MWDFLVRLYFFFYRLHFRLYENASLLRSYANEISVLETSVTGFDICWYGFVSTLKNNSNGNWRAFNFCYRIAWKINLPTAPGRLNQKKENKQWGVKKVFVRKLGFLTFFYSSEYGIVPERQAVLAKACLTHYGTQLHGCPINSR